LEPLTILPFYGLVDAATADLLKYEPWGVRKVLGPMTLLAPDSIDVAPTSVGLHWSGENSAISSEAVWRRRYNTAIAESINWLRLS
jgi:hypothetical protein